MNDKKVPNFPRRYSRNTKKSSKTYEKWRYPRGSDVQFRKEDGARPKIGYKANEEIRYKRKGYKEEIYVKNSGDFEKINSLNKDEIASFKIVFSSNLSKKSKKEFYNKLLEKGLTKEEIDKITNLNVKAME